MTYISKNSLVSLIEQGAKIESDGFMDAVSKKSKRFITSKDLSEPSNFVKYGLAEEYYKTSIEYIRKTFPFDGSLKEKTEWENELSYLEYYVYEQLYPRTAGYVFLNETQTSGTQSNLINSTLVTCSLYVNSNANYIKFYGNLNADSNFKNEENWTGSNSNIYDISKNRGKNLMVSPSGNTVEMWLKKDSFVTNVSGSNYVETLFDIYNNATSSASYGRLSVSFVNQSSSLRYMLINWVSGSDGIRNEVVDCDDLGTDLFDGEWRFCSFSFYNSDTYPVFKLYVNGREVIKKDYSGSSIISGDVGVCSGSLLSFVDNSYYYDHASFSQFSGSGVAYCKAYIDEVRIWKSVRSEGDINTFWNINVGGGTNTDDSNTELGIYYKFNEGITGYSQYDKYCLDYSGRLTTAEIVNYTSSIRNTGSAFIESNYNNYEFLDPVLYSVHPDYASLYDEYTKKGKVYDYSNKSFYKMFPKKLRDDDYKAEGELKKLCHIVGSYFDSLYLQIENLKDFNSKEYKTLDGIGRDVFGYKMLSSLGLVDSELFEEANIFEKYINKSGEVVFQEDVDRVKSVIYKNIFNNIQNVLKSKGTRLSVDYIRNLFGVDDSVLRLTEYKNNYKYSKFKNKYKEQKKRFVDFCNVDNYGACIFNANLDDVLRNLYFTSGNYVQELNSNFNIVGSMSLIMDVYPTYLNANGYWVIGVSSGFVNAQFGLRYGGGNYIQWVQGNSTGGFDTISIAPITINNNYRVVITKSGNTGVNILNANINGVDYIKNVTYASVSQPNIYLNIMKSPIVPAIPAMGGYVKHLSIYNRVLSAGERTNAIAGIYPDPSTAVGFWNFDEEVGNTHYDSSSNNIDLTSVGTTWEEIP